MIKYSFGRDTAYSAKIILEQIGYDFAELQTLSADDKFDFSIAVIPEIQRWFSELRSSIESPTVARFIAHALDFREEVAPNE
ncbi:hypothetical protein [Paenibacillus sp. BIHB 4019]|uniref:hypothetical protein n=1 Tax=Paenibacillus sp. BIHB 4019 TaxID=1870819 RepID=UPI0012377CCA|nr:hypothetical protein [Paenibacillus sp. BIHB 4019]